MAASWNTVKDQILADCGSPGRALRSALLACKADAEEVGWDREDRLDLIDALITYIREEFSTTSTWPGKSALGIILTAVGIEARGMLNGATIAHAVAWAIDEEFFARVLAEFQGRGAFELLADDLYVRPDADVYQRYQATHAANGWQQPLVSFCARGEHSRIYCVDPTQTPRTKLFRGVPGGINWRVWIDCTTADILNWSLPGLPAAGAVAPLGASEARSSGATTANGVFGMGPKGEQAAWDMTVAALVAAKLDGIEIAVVPELTVGRTITADLSHLAEIPALVLSGSRHRSRGPKRLNEARLHLNGVTVMTHEKVVPFGPAASMTLREDINKGPYVRILHSDRWAVAPLICSDLNQPEVGQTLIDLGANLVLVASLTERIGFFESTLTEIVTRTQGLAVWSNDSYIAVNDGRVIETSGFFFPSEYNKVRFARNTLPHTEPCTWDW